MDLGKSMLAQYAFVVAVNAGLMNDEVAAKLKQYDEDTIAFILKKRIDDLRAKALQLDREYFDAQYYEDSAKTVDGVLQNLKYVLSQP